MPEIIVFQMPAMEEPKPKHPDPGFREILNHFTDVAPMHVMSLMARASSESMFNGRIRWRRNEDGSFNLIRRRKK